jgi:putative phosphoesterase
MIQPKAEESIGKQAAMDVGVISDTHGLIRPEALVALGGCERILHTGDIGSRAVLEALRAIAPVVAIRGNCDKGPWARELPGTEVAEAGGHLIYLLHDLEDLELDPAAAGFRVVMSGHSHRPSVRERHGVLYLNPGSAGPRRFKLPVTVARLRLDANHAEAEIVYLFDG